MVVVTHGRHWPRPTEADEPESTPVGEHTHRQPRMVLVGLSVVVLMLIVSNGLTLLYGLSVNDRLTTLEEFVAGRGQQRDAENERLNDRIDAAVCSLLDSLPEGPLLAPQRTEYGCGPGIPVAELPPDVAQNLAEILGQAQAPQPAAATPEPAAPTSDPGDLPPGAPPGAQPSPMGQAPSPTDPPVTAAPAPATTPSAATTTPPLVDLSTVTDQVCNALGICL